MLRRFAYSGLAAFALCAQASAGDYSAVLERVKLPPGFEISIFAEMRRHEQMSIIAADLSDNGIADLARWYSLIEVRRLSGSGLFGTALAIG